MLGVFRHAPGAGLHPGGTRPGHVQDSESGPGERRAFTVTELQVLFDHLDDRVAAGPRLGAQEGWLPAFRDAVLVKTAYAFGLRRREVARDA